MIRGALSEKAQEIAKSFLGREITKDELRLYPFIDYTIKNGNHIDGRRINSNEWQLLSDFQKMGYMEYSPTIGDIYVTSSFYDYLQSILKMTYTIIINEPE